MSAEFATTLAQQLESGTLGVLAPAENGSSPEAAASGSSPDKADNKPATPAKAPGKPKPEEERPNKKARAPKPEVGTRSYFLYIALLHFPKLLTLLSSDLLCQNDSCTHYLQGSNDSCIHYLQGSDLELVMSGESTIDFVKEWVQAANAAGGQSVRICAECLSSIFYDKYNLQLDQDMFLIELAHAELQFLYEAGSA